MSDFLDGQKTGSPKGVRIAPDKARVKLLSNAINVGLPACGAVWAVVYFQDHRITWVGPSSFLLFYLLSGTGLSLGFHRLFTHGSYRSVRWLRLALAAMGSMTFQGPVIRWVADHRRHHFLADEEGDAHSPYYTAAGRQLKSHERFVHSHLLWMFDLSTTDEAVYAGDLLRTERSPRSAAPIGFGALCHWQCRGRSATSLVGLLRRLSLCCLVDSCEWWCFTP